MMSRSTILPSALRTADDLGFIDLFAGCGGLALGFVHEGFSPVGAVELDTDAAATYALNIDEQISTTDIAAVTTVPEARIVIGGPPCQGFSQLGTRDPQDPRNRLWREYVRIIDAAAADVFVMENVPQLLRSPQFHLFRSEATARGFELVEGVLNAADYGVPQTRRRAIVIGSRVGAPHYPAKTHGPDSRDKRPYVDVRSAFASPTPLPENPDGKNLHVGRPGIRESSIERYRAVPPSGGNRFQMQAALDASGRPDLVPACWRNKQSGTTDVFGRMWWDRPGPTIRTEFFKPEKGRYLHPEAHRPITLREGARLQSFPDDFEFPESQSMISVARQIGNAVPPSLAAAIARSVREHLDAVASGKTVEVRGRPARQLSLV
jgi:DNA (cytosine-5)-methyltransferase 1